MSAKIIPFRTDIDAAWDSYSALLRQTEDNPDLRFDRAHTQAVLRAHKRFRDLFLGMED